MASKEKAKAVFDDIVAEARAQEAEHIAAVLSEVRLTPGVVPPERVTDLGDWYLEKITEFCEYRATTLRAEALIAQMSRGTE